MCHQLYEMSNQMKTTDPSDTLARLSVLGDKSICGVDYCHKKGEKNLHIKSF